MNGQQLKKSILQLAIQGRLVPQNLKDEPASVLLARIREEKQRLVDEKIIKKSKPLSHITDDEKPFDIPESWEWVRLGEICTFLSRGRSPKYTEKSDIPVFAQKCNLKEGGISLDKAKFLDPNTLKSWNDIYKILEGDVLLNSTGTGTVGRTRLFKSEYLGKYSFTIPDSHITIVRTSDSIMSDYVFYVLSSFTIQKYFEDNLAGSTNQKELYINIVHDLCFPLPPLAEQHRIVAKIEELLPLVEEYDEAQKKLDKLNDGLPEKLKRSVLQQAIMGRLGTQNDKDEPASELLKRIKDEKAKLIKEKKIKKENTFAPITDEEKPFEIPESWAWVRLGEIVAIARGGSPRPIKEYLTESNDGINWIKIGDTDKDGKYINSCKEKIKVEGLNKTRKVYPGDFLLTNSMSFGRPYITNIEGCIHDGWLALSDYDKCYCSDFLFYLLLSPYAKKVFGAKVAGAVVKNLNTDKVAGSVFPLPPLAEQHRIVDKLDKIFEKIESMKK